MDFVQKKKIRSVSQEHYNINRISWRYKKKTLRITPALSLEIVSCYDVSTALPFLLVSLQFPRESPRQIEN